MTTERRIRLAQPITRADLNSVYHAFQSLDVSVGDEVRVDVSGGGATVDFIATVLDSVEPLVTEVEDDD